MSIRTQPAYDAVAVDISEGDDTLALLGPCDAIYIGGDGDVTLTTMAGRSATFVGLAAGSVLPVGAKAILDTSTASNLVALYTAA